MQRISGHIYKKKTSIDVVFINVPLYVYVIRIVLNIVYSLLFRICFVDLNVCSICQIGTYGLEFSIEMYCHNCLQGYLVLYFFFKCDTAVLTTQGYKKFILLAIGMTGKFMLIVIFFIFCEKNIYNITKRLDLMGYSKIQVRHCMLHGQI